MNQEARRPNKIEEQKQSDQNNSNIESSNPFQIKINQIGISNPFQMNLGQVNPFQMNLNKENEPKLFLQKQESQQQNDLFSKIMKDNQKTGFGKNSMPYSPKFTKVESKMQGSHSEQNLKKYKDVLKILYDQNYWKKAKNLDQSWKKLSKDNPKQVRKPQNCFKANRLIFNKQNKAKLSSYQKVEQHYMICYANLSKQIVIYQLKEPNINYIKPIVIKFINDEQISSSIEYDVVYGRVFYFSNSRQQIVVIGTKDKQVICRVQIKCQRINPLLHIYKYKSSIFLIVIGGYRVLNQTIVEGCKYIQIFNVDKWQISLKQVVLKLGIGRISPIVFSCDYENQPCLLIVGGCSNASLNRKKQIAFNVDEDINYSTNQTAVRIDLSFIQDCFISNQQNHSMIINNTNVRFDSPLQLYGGSVLFRKLTKSQKLQLFLPCKKNIYAIKTLKNDVHIIESELGLEKQISLQKNGNICKSIGYHRDSNNMFELYKIDEHGKLCSMTVVLNPKKTKQSTAQCLVM